MSSGRALELFQWNVSLLSHGLTLGIDSGSKHCNPKRLPFFNPACGHLFSSRSFMPNILASHSFKESILHKIDQVQMYTRSGFRILFMPSFALGPNGVDVDSEAPFEPLVKNSQKLRLCRSTTDDGFNP